MQKIAAIVFAVVSGFVAAQDSRIALAGGEYALRVNQVYGAILTAQYMGEVCTTAFPDQSQSNTAAFSEWRSRYLPFIEEMERRFSDKLEQEANGDQEKRAKLLATVNVTFESIRTDLKSGLAARGPDAFKKGCSAYSLYLAFTNPERDYSEYMAVIRKGPLK